MIVLPWPDKRVFPNAKNRKHWRSYAPAVKADREMGKFFTLEQMSPKARQSVKEGEGHIAMTVTFFPPDKRRRDDDGCIGGFKHLRDGIADALGVDDHRFRATYQFEDALAPGRVEVRFA